MKKIIRVCCLIGCLIVLVVGVIVVVNFSDENNITSSTSESELYITDVIPTEIFVYGDELTFSSDVYMDQIDEISEDSIMSNWKYNFIILNDPNGNMSLSDEEMDLLNTYVVEKYYNIIYLGSNLCSDLYSAFNITSHYNSKNFLVFLGSNAYSISDYDLTDCGFDSLNFASYIVKKNKNDDYILDAIERWVSNWEN